MDAKEYLTNKAFCPIPWQGLMYNFDGSVKTCIRSAEPIGNIKDNTIEEIVNGSDNIENRMDMRMGHPAKNCYPCYALEKDKNSFDIISDRVFYLKELRNSDMSLYDSPGTFGLRKIDVRWTNLCNFACVYCSPEFSSKWASELNTNRKSTRLNSSHTDISRMPSSA